MKKVLKIIITIILIVAIGAYGTYYYISNRFEYNNDNATGNTAGNLNNGGLFCEYNGKIYFANPYDNNYLYVMDSDCTNARKLNSDSVAYLNVCGNYIYYVKNNFSRNSIGVVFRGQLFGLYRTDLEGKETKALYDELSGPLSLCGNYIYYQHYSDSNALQFYKAKIDGSENIFISDSDYNPASVYNGKIYFSDPENRHNICCYDTAGGRVTTYYETNSYKVDAENNYIYYIDVTKGYALVRLNMTTKTLEQLYDDNGKVVNYNLYGNKIFFQTENGDNTGLYRMNADGTQLEYLAAGNLTNINCTSQYTFFQYYENQGTLYRVPTIGAITKVEEITIK
ncbi:MAG: DUF5050 domain-containing protein, partial [Eubacteriales bacterium]|nr:DUF5050 domain-containing protein [Eubacteriales bacterium]